MRANDLSEILISPSYIPYQDEEYMNPQMLSYFKKKLLKWRADIVQQSQLTMQQLQRETQKESDPNDRASTEADRAFELHTRERNRKLLSSIDNALIRIEEGEYGYCEETGDPIGIARLMARPIVTMSIEAQEHYERAKRMGFAYRA